MDRDDMRELVAEYCRRVWNEHDLDALDDYAAPVTLLLDPAIGSVLETPDELKQRVATILARMPDHRMEVGTIVSGDDETIFQWRVTGHWSDPPRGSFPVDFGGMTYWRIENGRISVRDGISDVATFGWQIDVYPARLRMLIPV